MAWPLVALVSAVLITACGADAGAAGSAPTSTSTTASTSTSTTAGPISSAQPSESAEPAGAPGSTSPPAASAAASPTTDSPTTDSATTAATAEVPAAAAGHYEFDGPGVIRFDPPPDPPVVLTLSCPSCSGPVSVMTDGYPPRAIWATGPYQGSVLLGASGAVPTVLTVTANARWTASVVPIADHPPAPPSSSGQGDAVLLLPGPASRLDLEYQGADEYSMVVYQADGTSLTLHSIGPMQESVAAQLPAVIAIVAAGAWSVAAS